MHLQQVEIGRSHCRPFTPREQGYAVVGSSEREAMLEFTVALTTFYNTVLSLGSVKRVGVKARGESFSVWTFVDNPSHEVLMKIYAAEIVFRNAIPGMIFDFAVKYEDTATAPPDFYVFQGR